MDLGYSTPQGMYARQGARFTTVCRESDENHSCNDLSQAAGSVTPLRVALQALSAFLVLLR